jgi:hypothetical protein
MPVPDDLDAAGLWTTAGTMTSGRLRSPTHLLVDWREGARFFLQHLMDGDLPANNGGWQWVAGTGTDAAPYYRIFNPVTQAEKFDPTATTSAP